MSTYETFHKALIDSLLDEETGHSNLATIIVTHLCSEERPDTRSGHTSGVQGEHLVFRNVTQHTRSDAKLELFPSSTAVIRKKFVFLSGEGGGKIEDLRVIIDVTASSSSPRALWPSDLSTLLNAISQQSQKPSVRYDPFLRKSVWQNDNYCFPFTFEAEMDIGDLALIDERGQGGETKEPAKLTLTVHVEFEPPPRQLMVGFSTPTD